MNDPETEKIILNALHPACEICGQRDKKLFARSGHIVCNDWGSCLHYNRIKGEYEKRSEDYLRIGGPAFYIFPDGRKESATT